MEIKKKRSHFINYDSIDSVDGVIDNSFHDIILTHIIGNYDATVQSPLFLAIQGNPGEGKTFQTLNICKNHNLKICYYSGAELSGNYEKDSILELSDDYTRACNYYSEGEYSVIIIDDFHLSPASTKDGVGTTINSQLLTGYLMNLCDKAKSKQIDSIPIILLANTFKDVYDPLKRDGRMDFFCWSTSYKMKIQIVNKIFRDYLSPVDYFKLEEFVEQYQDQPTSFFSEIKNDVDKSYIKERLNKLGHKNISVYISAISHSKFKKINIKKLYEFADLRLANRKYSNEGDKWSI